MRITIKTVIYVERTFFYRVYKRFWIYRLNCFAPLGLTIRLCFFWLSCIYQIFQMQSSLTEEGAVMQYIY